MSCKSLVSMQIPVQAGIWMRWGRGLVSQDEKEQPWTILLPLPPEWDGNRGRKAWESEGMLNPKLQLCLSHLVGILIILYPSFLFGSWFIPCECRILWFHGFEI